MYKKYHLLILLTLSFLNVIGQRPMSKEFIVSKLDSIKNEADIIYNHCMILRLTKQKFESTAIDNKNIVITGVDTIKVSVLNDDNAKIYEANYLNQNPLLLLNEKTSTTKLNDSERLFFLLKQKIINQIKQPEYGINDFNQNNIQYVLFPCKEGLKFYAFSDYRINDTIVFGRNFLFYCDVLGTIKSHKEFHMKQLKIPVNNHLGNPRDGFIIKYTKENPFILAADIATFRLKNRPKELYEFGVFSDRNKVHMNYDAIENKISIGNF